MKFRHVRAVAACALVVVALTGARHSHGGGCGSSHSSSSSSSGGYSSSGSTTSSGSTVGSPTAGSTTPPESDIRITDCQVDSAAGTLSAKLSVTNHNSQGSAHYNGTVQFTDESGAVFGSAQISVAAVPMRLHPARHGFRHLPQEPQRERPQVRQVQAGPGLEGQQLRRATALLPRGVQGRPRYSSLAMIERCTSVAPS